MASKLFLPIHHIQSQLVSPLTPEQRVHFRYRISKGERVFDVLVPAYLKQHELWERFERAARAPKSVKHFSRNRLNWLGHPYHLLHVLKHFVFEGSNERRRPLATEALQDFVEALMRHPYLKLLLDELQRDDEAKSLYGDLFHAQDPTWTRFPNSHDFALSAWKKKRLFHAPRRREQRRGTRSGPRIHKATRTRLIKLRNDAIMAAFLLGGRTPIEIAQMKRRVPRRTKERLQYELRSTLVPSQATLLQPHKRRYEEAKEAHEQDERTNARRLELIEHEYEQQKTAIAQRRLQMEQMFEATLMQWWDESEAHIATKTPTLFYRLDSKGKYLPLTPRDVVGIITHRILNPRSSERKPSKTESPKPLTRDQESLRRLRARNADYYEKNRPRLLVSNALKTFPPEERASVEPHLVRLFEAWEG